MTDTLSSIKYFDINGDEHSLPVFRRVVLINGETWDAVTGDKPKDPCTRCDERKSMCFCFRAVEYEHKKYLFKLAGRR